MVEKLKAVWRDMASAPKDGSEILLLAHGMVIQARYHPGEWSEDTPIAPAEYSGALWVGFDDAVQFEVEEGAGPNGEDLHGPVTGWLPLEALATRPTDEVEKLREALKNARNTLMHVSVESGYCCCGEPIEGHSIGSGHSPVDADQYAVQQIIEAIDTALSNAGAGE